MPRDFSDECFCLFLINQIVVRFRCETPDCFTHEMVFRRHWEISAQRGSRSAAGATYQCAIRGAAGRRGICGEGEGDFVGASLLANGPRCGSGSRASSFLQGMAVRGAGSELVVDGGVALLAEAGMGPDDGNFPSFRHCPEIC